MCGQAPRAINLRSVSILDASLDSDNAALKKYPELTVDLQINSRPFAKMIIDTGADETILNEDTWQKLGSPPMQNTTKNVRAYGGGKYELLGSVFLDVSMHGSPPLQLTAYVVQGNLGHDLIGRPWLYELGLLSQHLKVQSYTTGPKGPQAPPILNPAIGQYIKTLHKEFPKVFEEGLGHCIKKAQLYLKQGSIFSKMRARPVPKGAEAAVNAELERLVALKIITPVDFSDWYAPIVVVKKKSDGKNRSQDQVRICADFSTGHKHCLSRDEK
ncbi:gag-polyprotein putative aspartyl protease domain-containing protein [Ditylenchus destructor]|uniref:Gag-polyprotein putative aspartyl protease domain-containing protein n=1 Tax=Ditylenchus destructor TaxID=166010 RepID=A0AAD4NBH5_9BILA|nr:gag-polyprotein putative aspartyl protease domain-containing protein [Ditylenchus destructor]